MPFPARMPVHLPLTLLSLFAVGCPEPKNEPPCPSGTVNAGNSIRKVDCATVIDYEGKDFESSLKVKGLAEAGVKNSDTVLREVSEAANDAQIQFTQMCELYNGCNLTGDDYSRKLQDAQEHFRRIREKVSLIEAAQGNPEMLREAFAQLYYETIPETRVAETSLSVEFSLQARSGGQVQVVRDGQTLRTGDEVVFAVRASQNAHVYIFQKKPDGHVDVLFPNAEITSVANPIPAAELVRIPPQGQVFTVDDKDLGRETVYIAASREPLADLNAALSGESGQAERIATAMDNLFDETSPECAEKTRGLEVTSDCGERTRGLAPAATSNDAFFTEGASVKARTAPGDDVVIRSFTFEHTN